VTVFGLVFTPVFYVIASWAIERLKPKPRPQAPAALPEPAE
jgi:hypothetical protein